MMDLDSLISRTPAAARPAFDVLEQRVWREVDVRDTRIRSVRVRMAALTVAALVGGLSGLAAPERSSTRSELAVFSPSASALFVGATLR
jgi:hypothetical protein